MPDAPIDYRPEEDFARGLDEADPLRGHREQFHLPPGPDGHPLLYFCGNSLGLQPKAVAGAVEQELEDWSRLAVDAHFGGRTPWYRYHETLREPASPQSKWIADESPSV